ncbi:MAG: RDD family protein [Myxococcota bacterium]
MPETRPPTEAIVTSLVAEPRRPPEIGRREVEVETAGTLRRAGAAALDAMPLLVVAGVSALVGLFGSLPDAMGQYNLFDRFIDVANGNPALLLGPLAVFAVAEVAWHAVCVTIGGSTPGKRVLGLRVVGPGGRRPGPIRASIHALLRVVSLATLGFGHLTAIPDPARRTLSDRLAGVFVVVDAKP